VTYQAESSHNKASYTAQIKWREYETKSPQALLAFLAFGIIPTWAKEDTGVCFILKSTGNPSETCNVEVAWTGTTLMGWVMLFANLSSDRSYSSSCDSERYRDRMKLAVLNALAVAK